MFPLIAPVRRSMRPWLRDLFDTSRPYTGDGGLVMDMSPSILGRYSPLMPSFLIEHEPGFCGSLRQNLNHEFLGGSKQLFWCQKHIKIIKNPLCLARCSRASHDRLSHDVQCGKRKALFRLGCFSSKEVDFVSHLGHGTGGWQHPLLSEASDGYNLSELIFTCFSPTNLCRLRKKMSISYPTFCPKSS